MSGGAQGVAVAMSGGLDSSVVAHLLAAGGNGARTGPVVGLSMLLWDRSGVERSGRCCASLDVGDARRVAAQVGIPHYTLRMDGEFRRRVVDPFVDDYLRGRTPSPCVRCNTFIKFDAFLERARDLGMERIATGHYARVRRGPSGLELHAAADGGKDQSYFLFELTQDQLEATLFPLGELSKDEVRRIACRAGLAVAEKGESMEICFVDRDVRSFVEEQAGRRSSRTNGKEGSGAEVVDRDGRLLGEGAPYYRYTVGQRRGLGVATGRRLFVVDIEPAKNRVVVGGREELLAGGLEGERTSWIGPPPGDAVRVTVRIRSRHRGVGALVEPLGGGRSRVRFDADQEAVTPGQAAVFYEGTRVLGGCWIERSLPASTKAVRGSARVRSHG